MGKYCGCVFSEVIAFKKKIKALLIGRAFLFSHIVYNRLTHIFSFGSRFAIKHCDDRRSGEHKNRIMKILGRYDRVDLPELGLVNIHAKIDTGAYTCSLHCHRAQVIDGKLEFVLLDEEHPEFTGMKFVFPRFEIRNIKNSFGEVEKRYVIQTSIKIYGEEITTEFSLSNRGSLKFPILIGRKILRDRFMIDVKKRNLSYKHKRSALKKTKHKNA